MYKIIYIDEYKEDIENFLDYFEEKDTQGYFEIIALFPKKNIEETIEEIFANKPDAVISDYMLNEYKTDIDYNIPYTGVDLIEKILESKEKFPAFVMTSYYDQAIKTSEDVNIVYIKDILHGSEEKTNAKANFVYTVQNQIIHYKKRIEEAKKELEELIKKDYLDASDEARLLELDTYIEKVTNSPSSIPPHLKSMHNLTELHKMIDNTEKLLSELKGK